MGCEIAIDLGKQGKQVTLVEMVDSVAWDVEPLTQITLLEMLAEQRITVVTGHKLVEVNDEGAVIMDRDWNKTQLPADNVILALGRIPNKEILEHLSNTAPIVIPLGDCVDPGDIGDCIQDAFVHAVMDEPKTRIREKTKHLSVV